MLALGTFKYKPVSSLYERRREGREGGRDGGRVGAAPMQHKEGAAPAALPRVPAPVSLRERRGGRREGRRAGGRGGGEACIHHSICVCSVLCTPYSNGHSFNPPSLPPSLLSCSGAFGLLDGSRASLLHGGLPISGGLGAAGAGGGRGGGRERMQSKERTTLALDRRIVNHVYSPPSPSLPPSLPPSLLPSSRT